MVKGLLALHAKVDEWKAAGGAVSPAAALPRPAAYLGCVRFKAGCGALCFVLCALSVF